jgi:hypothetical protein
MKLGNHKINELRNVTKNNCVYFDRGIAESKYSFTFALPINHKHLLTH